MINDQVHTLFGNGLQAVPHDAFALFTGPLEDLLQWLNTYKEQWVELVEAVMWQKKHHEYRVYLSEQWGMQWWLGLEETTTSRSWSWLRMQSLSIWLRIHQDNYFNGKQADRESEVMTKSFRPVVQPMMQKRDDDKPMGIDNPIYNQWVIIIWSFRSCVSVECPVKKKHISASI